MKRSTFGQKGKRPLRLRRRKPFIVYAIRGYAVMILLWLLLRTVFQDSIWWLALINSYAVWLFVPVPLLLLSGILRKAGKRALLWLLIPLLVFAFLYGHLFWFNGRGDEGSAGYLLTAMSYNILFSNQEFDAIADEIRAANADIVGLQEVTSEQAIALERVLGDEYPFFYRPDTGRRNNAALMSKFPIEQMIAIDFPPRQLALHAVVTVDEQPVHVFVTHLMPNQLAQLDEDQALSAKARDRFNFRLVEVTNLQLEMERIADPVLLLCDCNLTDTSWAYGRLDEFLDDSFAEAGWGLGHTGLIPYLPFPTYRIDYVWHSQQFTAVSATRGNRAGSDHLPVIATLSLR